MARERTSARHAPRLEVTLPATLVFVDASRATLPVTTHDLGPGGTLCESAAPVEAGLEASFRLDLPATPTSRAETLALPARIVRVDGAKPWVIAIQFIRPPARIVELLKRYLWRMSRAAGRS